MKAYFYPYKGKPVASRMKKLERTPNIGDEQWELMNEDFGDKWESQLIPVENVIVVKNVMKAWAEIGEYIGLYTDRRTLPTEVIKSGQPIEIELTETGCKITAIK